MKWVPTLSLLLIVIFVADAQTSVVEDKSVIKPTLDERGDMVVTPSATSSARDFDFLMGRWRVHTKRLKTRLNNCQEWLEFEATARNRPLLSGIANLDLRKSEFLGIASESMSLRIFNQTTNLWSMYWADSKSGVMDPVVEGSFDGDVGLFYGKNIYNGVPVLVVFKWDKTNPEKPEGSQAYSTDNGKTWEWNLVTVFTRLPDESDEVTKSFLPGIVSTDSTDFNAAFSPDGKSFYFSRSISKRTRIFAIRKTANTWSVPSEVSFSTTRYSDADPAFSPAGELYFISNRPRNEQDTIRDYDIWKVIPKGDDQWSQPFNVRDLNSEKDEYYISFTKNGDAYFASSRDGGFGEEDIYASEKTQKGFASPVNLGEAINTIHSEYDPFITSDGSGLIFTSSGRKDSFGKADLYWSVKTKNKWMGVNHFGEEINSPTRDYCPYIPADSKYFFFSSERDVKFVDLLYLPEKLKASFRGQAHQ
jgi:hypothetical protein